MIIESVGTPGLWIGFTIFILAMLALDLGVFHRRAHAISLKEGVALERRMDKSGTGLQRRRLFLVWADPRARVFDRIPHRKSSRRR